MQCASAAGQWAGHAGRLREVLPVSCGPGRTCMGHVGMWPMAVHAHLLTEALLLAAKLHSTGPHALLADFDPLQCTGRWAGSMRSVRPAVAAGAAASAGASGWAASCWPPVSLNLQHAPGSKEQRRGGALRTPGNQGPGCGDRAGADRHCWAACALHQSLLCPWTSPRGEASLHAGPPLQGCEHRAGGCRAPVLPRARFAGLPESVSGDGSTPQPTELSGVTVVHDDPRFSRITGQGP